MKVESVPVAILAGGLATRLHPITKTIPKSMVTVAGRPFLEHQLEYLRRQGVRRVVLCAGYLGEQIQAHFGDGRGWGMEIEYAFDGPVLLGTGGAIKRTIDLLGDTFFVLYGDSFLPTDFQAVLNAFEHSDALALMTVYHNHDSYDRSNVVFEDGRIVVYDKKNRAPRMHHIDYGLSVIRARAFDRVPADEPSDLAALFADLVKTNELAGFEIAERFYEIGSPAGLAELDELLSRQRAATSL